MSYGPIDYARLEKHVLRALESHLEHLKSYLDTKLDTSLSSIDSKLDSIDSKLGGAVKIAETLQTLDNSGGSTTAAIDVFESDIVVPDTGELAVQLALSENAKARLRIVRGGTTLEYYLNSGNALAANSWYEFVVTVLKDDAVNIVVEVPAGSTINAYAALILRRR